MLLLNAHDLVLRRADRDVVRVASLELRAGMRVGLTGANGSGKSTLLSALAGRLAPFEGHVERAPGTRVAYVEQASPTWDRGATLLDVAAVLHADLALLAFDLERAHAAAARDPRHGERYAELLAEYDARGGFTQASRLHGALQRVGIDASRWSLPASSCSVGERQRARLVGALTSDADVLLLDEPSNHLDLDRRAWLAERLSAWRGAVVVASHDRALLRRTTTHVATLERGSFHLRRGDHRRASASAAAEQRAARRSADARAARITELERLAAELARFGNRGAQTRRRRAERERERLVGETPPADDATRAPPGDVATSPGGAERPARPPNEVLVRARHLHLPGVLDDASFDLHGGQRVALVGPAGSGKSALLDLLAGAGDATDPRSHVQWRDGVRLLYLDQRLRGLDPETSPRRALEAWVGPGRASGALAAVGLEFAAWGRPVAQLSGGQRMRAALALAQVREADVLLLDEPTSDLDLEAIEALERWLVSERSAMVLVSSDEALVDALEPEVIAIERGALVPYRGGLAGYRRGRRRLEPGAHATATPSDDADLSSDEARSAVGTPAESGEASDAIDRERATVAAALEDPLRWSERELERWRERGRRADEALLQAFEADASPPAPRFRTREAGLDVVADRAGEHLTVRLHDGPRLVVRCVGRVGHMMALVDDDREPVPWASRVLATAAARLAIYLLPIDAVQVTAPDDRPPPAPLTSFADGWWMLERDVLERVEGWTR